ncbi:hypothetical protein O181_107718 [Austropuccinia psidii MF-1]|uniref:Uncharacterized protein n=1 Tax=Austropuccinia psidii MF-1 TaxID=1389203 RepID=A0A9Q3JSZ9_9BASI|nr:hypothetical protein [Austropuccinia psidii MF-1]
MSQEPFGKSKQPALNIPSGSQVHVGNEKRVDGGQQKRPLENVTRSYMAPKGKTVPYEDPIEDCEELYASSPLVHKEKVTELHHPYASKPRTAHANSSREKIMNDEDEIMSPSHSETNDEPRSDNFTPHEEGTQSNNQTARKPGLKSSQCGKMFKPTGATKMAESRTPRKCPCNEISCTHPFPVPTQSEGGGFVLTTSTTQHRRALWYSIPLVPASSLPIKQKKK